MARMRITSFEAGLLGLLFALAGCGSGSEPSQAIDAGGATDDGPGTVASITLSPNDLVLAPIGAAALTAEAHDATGAAVTAAFTWRSSDESVATVADGLVTALTPGQAQITASASGISSSPATVMVVVGSSTSELLAKAVAAGAITADQALVYEVFALFGDARLPDEYRGSPTGKSLRHDLLMVEAAARFDSMTADQQAAIGPYFVPPAYVAGVSAAARPAVPDFQTDRPGFCSEKGQLRSDWKSIATDHFRVWWDSVALSTAAGFIDEIASDAEFSYGKLVGDLRFRAPLDDAASPSWLCNGGDGKLDIYIVDTTTALPGAYAVTVPISSDWTTGKATPAYILVSPLAITTHGGTWAGSVLRGVIAHELMHAIQFSYLNLGRNDHTWALEATATWAQDKVFPLDQTEHVYVDAFLSRMDQPLFYPNQTCLGSSPSPVCLGDSQADLKMYGAYLFFQWASRSLGGSPVRRYFEAADGLTGESLAAVEAGLGEPWDQAWNDFVLALWNGGEVPETKVFRDWDSEYLKPDFTDEPLSGDPVDSPDFLTAPSLLKPGDLAYRDVDLNELSVVYHRYTFEPSVRSLIFYNGFSRKMSTQRETPTATIGPTPHLVSLYLGPQAIAYDTTADERGGRHLWALKKVAGPSSSDGTWTVEDWTDLAFVPLCLDKASERVEELVLIFSNSAHDLARSSDFTANAVGPVGDQRATIVASAVPCWKYQGTFDASLDYQDGTDNFSMASTLSATYVGKAEIQTASGPLGTGTALRSWRFVADPATVMLTRTLRQGCSGPPTNVLHMEESGAEFFTIGPPSFDTVVPFPLGPSYAGVWSNVNHEINGVTWSFTNCQEHPAVTPLMNPFNLTLYFDAWQKIDLAGMRLASPTDGARAPVDDPGSYPGAGDVINRWCLAPLREGEAPPAVCP